MFKLKKRYQNFCVSLNSINKIKNNKFFLLKRNKKNSCYFTLNKINNKSTINIKSYIRLEKESIAKINNSVDFFLKNNCLNVELTSNNFFPFNEKKRNLVSSTIFLLRKNKILMGFGRRKQNFYTLLNIIYCLKEDFFNLISREVFNNYFSILGVKKDIILFYTLKNFLSWNFCYSTLENNSNFYKYNIIWNKNIISHLIYSVIYMNSSFGDSKKNFLVLDFQDTNLKKTLDNFIENETYNSKVTYNKLLRQKQFSSFFEGRSLNIIDFKEKPYVLNYVKQTILQSYLKYSKYIWKRAFITQRSFFFNGKKRSFGWKGQHNFYNREVSKSILALLVKLNEKNKLILGDEEAKSRLLLLRNILINQIQNKIKKEKAKTLVLGTLALIKKLRRKKWMSTFLKKLSKTLQNENNISFSSTLSLPLNPKFKENISFDLEIKSKRRHSIRKKSLWKEKKLVNTGINAQFNQINKFFSFIFKNTTSLFFVNALSLTKFAFVYPHKKKSVQKFLNQIEREMIEKYKYVAVYIQDLVRVSFISLFLKKPAFLTAFIGFQIYKLPRNRKETNLIRFIIKVVRIFSSQRREMFGMKIEFKGRVNRWRRTKIIRGVSGVLPLYSYETRIEFGSNKAITRKGALGIRLWLCYHPYFEKILRNALSHYVQYSQEVRSLAIKKFLNKFQSKLK